ncbi:hypothetical protein [Rhizobium mongolense]|uniref:hypothetical protein n=1 Tax=Rhizobium mongolense TaxID=57676 RepID=UPI0034A3E0BA
MADEEIYKYDLLVPLEMPSPAEFWGTSWRAPFVRNGEVGFQFGVWEASYHRFQERPYIVVRTAASKDELAFLACRILRMIGRAAVKLDISIRPVRGPICFLRHGERADLSQLSGIPSEEVPDCSFPSETYSISLPVIHLSHALGFDEEVEDGQAHAEEEVYRVFSDVDFEASVTSRFISLSTILELMAERTQRDAEAVDLLSTWEKEAKAKNRHDLAQALNLMRHESIGSAIAKLVENAAVKASLPAEKVARYKTKARDAYRKRSSLLHAGVKVSVEELASLREIVRLILVGDTSGTGFTPIANKEWD